MKPVFDHCFWGLLKEPFVRIFRAVLKPNLVCQQFFQELYLWLWSLLSSASSVIDHADFSTTCKKIPRYSGELPRQMANHFTALYNFHDVFVHGVVKFSFSKKFFSD